MGNVTVGDDTLIDTLMQASTPQELRDVLSAVARDGSDVEVAAFRAALGLGTAALKNVGSASGDLVELGAGGLVPSARLPTMVFTEVVEVADEAARLALTSAAAEGKIVVQIDTGRVYGLPTGSDPTVDGNWLNFGDRKILSADIEDAADDHVDPANHGKVVKSLPSGQIAGAGLRAGDAANFGTVIIGDGSGGWSVLKPGSDGTPGMVHTLPAAAGTLETEDGAQAKVDALKQEVLTVADAAARKNPATYSAGQLMVGVTKVVQSDLPFIVWFYIGDDATLDSSWYGVPYTVTPGGDLEIASDLKVGGSTLFVDAATGRVGVGTDSPSTYFHVVGGGSAFRVHDGYLVFTGSSFYMGSGSYSWNLTNASITRQSSDSFSLRAGGNDVLLIEPGALTAYAPLSFNANSGSWDGAIMSGPQTHTGQLELTGQSAATDDSAMTRGLGDERYGLNGPTLNYFAAHSVAQSVTGTGSVSTGTGPDAFAISTPATGDEAGWVLDAQFWGGDGSGSSTQLNRHNIEVGWTMFRTWFVSADFEFVIGIGVLQNQTSVLTGTEKGIQLVLESVASTSFEARFVFGDGTAATSSAAVDFTPHDTDLSNTYFYRIITNRNTRSIKFQRAISLDLEWVDVLTATYPTALSGSFGSQQDCLTMSAAAGSTPPGFYPQIKGIYSRLRTD